MTLVFFSKQIREVSGSFSGLLQTSDEENEEQGDDGETGESPEGDNAENGQFNAFNWLNLINRVSDRTKLNWTQIWELNIFEFLNYLKFDIEYRKWEEAELNKWKQNH